jgi:N-acetylglucosamine-6-phosphate deacetylase
MDRTLLRNVRILDPEGDELRPGSLLLEEGRIRAHLTHNDAIPGDARVIDLAGAFLSPGFIDLHFHGSAIFSDAENLNRALRVDAASCVRHGTTAFLPTTVTGPVTHLAEFVTQAASFISERPNGTAQAIGLHLEGPWIQPGAAGAQAKSSILPYRRTDGAELFDRAGGVLRLVTYAPEIAGAAELQDELTRRGIVGALGHSLASAESVTAATDRGARHVTHLFNAMGSFHHRKPGLAAAAMSDDRLTCDLICDGVHIHPRTVAIAARAAAGRLVLITDRVSPSASGSGAEALGSDSLHAEGGAWHLADGRLAGSSLSLDAALRNWIEFTGSSLVDAVRACTLEPARVLGVEADRGTLRPGARADLVILDDSLGVRETWVGGERVYTA